MNTKVIINMTREKKAQYNIITNILLQMALAISGFLIPRLILSAYGSTVNGLINSIAQFLTYAALVEAGVGDAALSTLYKPMANENINQVSGIISSVKKRYFWSGVVYAGIVCILALVYPIVVRGQLEYSFVFSMVIIIAMANLVDYWIIGKYKVLLLSDQKNYIINFIRAIATCVLTVISCILLVHEGSVLTVKLLAIAIHLVEGICIRCYTLHAYPEIDFSGKTENIAIPQQTNALLHQISSVITYNTDLVVLTIFLTGSSLKEVSVYTTYALAFGIINNLLTSFTLGFDALFGNMIARKEYDRLKRFFDAYEYWYSIILYIMFACFITLIVPFVAIYTKGITDVNYIRLDVGILFGINGILAALKNPQGMINRSIGAFKQTQKYVIQEAVLNIIISIILVRKFGIVGVLVGTLISHIFADVGIIRYANRKVLQKSSVSTVKNNIVNFIAVIILCVVEIRFMPKIISWPMWVLYSIGIFVCNTIVIICANAVSDLKNFKLGWNFIKAKIS